VPAATFRAADGILEALPRHAGIGNPRSRKVQANASNADFAHPVQSGVGGLLVDDGHTARHASERAHAVEGAGVVRPIHARLHNDDALETKGGQKLTKLLHRCGLWCVHAAGEKRVLLGIAEHVDVTIATASRHVETHFGLRLRSDRLNGHAASNESGYTSRHSRLEHVASCQHGGSIERKMEKGKRNSDGD
jgi:hypothetical protein